MKKPIETKLLVELTINKADIPKEYKALSPQEYIEQELGWLADSQIGFKFVTRQPKKQYVLIRQQECFGNGFGYVTTSVFKTKQQAIEASGLAHLEDAEGLLEDGFIEENDKAPHTIMLIQECTL